MTDDEVSPLGKDLAELVLAILHAEIGSRELKTDLVSLRAAVRAEIAALERLEAELGAIEEQTDEAIAEPGDSSR